MPQIFQRLTKYSFCLQTQISAMPSNQNSSLFPLISNRSKLFRAGIVCVVLSAFIFGFNDIVKLPPEEKQFTLFCWAFPLKKQPEALVLYFYQKQPRSYQPHDLGFHSVLLQASATSHQDLCQGQRL